MGELASAAPTSGGLYFWTYALSSPRWRNFLCWIVGCRFAKSDVWLPPLTLAQTPTQSATSLPSHPLISDAPCKSWLRSALEPTALSQPPPRKHCTPAITACLRRLLTWVLSGVYVAIVVGNILVCSFGTAVLARLQAVYIVLNVLFVFRSFAP
jgi:amino acid transporter